MSNYRIVEVDRPGQEKDTPVAWCDSVTDIGHYAAVYGQDGPIRVERRVGKKWKEINFI